MTAESFPLTLPLPVTMPVPLPATQPVCLPPSSPARDAIGAMTNRMLTMAVDELRKEETQQRVRLHLVDPLVKMMSQQMMPYVLVLFALVSAILLTTLLTFTMFAMSLFGRLGRRDVRP